jgi:hypothetical protein
MENERGVANCVLPCTISLNGIYRGEMRPRRRRRRQWCGRAKGSSGKHGGWLL